MRKIRSTMGVWNLNNRIVWGNYKLYGLCKSAFRTRCFGLRKAERGVSLTVFDTDQGLYRSFFIPHHKVPTHYFNVWDEILRFRKSENLDFPKKLTLKKIFKELEEGYTLHEIEKDYKLEEGTLAKIVLGKDK